MRQRFAICNSRSRDGDEAAAATSLDDAQPSVRVMERLDGRHSLMAMSDYADSGEIAENIEQLVDEKLLEAGLDCSKCSVSSNSASF
jgi:hypothetical protein